ncbi:hypothetical protein Tsubulata_038269 [Turnera subulata]|uniref:A-kinase anchor protein 7-like phosphoesterase domain-containing protein n=1 Tax=Turnera subulata TaxID=218843 RepID=A0A9Q0J8N0_9ROSI|nr:hypothetical protein Tsubulata_038269 [Turnera subulata]
MKRDMASLDSPNSPPNSSFAIRDTSYRFLRSISSKETPSFPHFPCTSPRLSSTSNTFPSSPYSSPPHSIASTPNNLVASPEATYRCLSSVLKKDGQILSMAISNGLLYTGSAANLIRLWKLPEFTECGQLRSRACRVVAMGVAHGRIYAAYGDGKIRVWRRTLDGTFRHIRLATIPSTGGCIQSCISRKDKRVKHMAPITSLAINISDDIIYSASLDKTVKVWRISDQKCIETIQAHTEQINAIVVSDDGILYTASDDATVRIWRRNFYGNDRPHALTTTLPAKHSPIKALTLTSDNGVLYGGCSDGYIHYWHRGWFSGQMQYGGALQGHTHAVLCMDNVGNYVVSGSADSTCRVWTRESDGQHIYLAVLVGHRGPVRCVSAFLERGGDDHQEDGGEDGCRICSASLDGVLKMWRVTRMNRDGVYLSQYSNEADGVLKFAVNSYNKSNLLNHFQGLGGTKDVSFGAMGRKKKAKTGTFQSRPVSTPASSVEEIVVKDENMEPEGDQANGAETSSCLNASKVIKRQIEEEMGVKIVFPSSKEEESIIIEGSSIDGVNRASEKIQAIIDKAIVSPSLQYSHFISLPLAIHPELVDKLVNFQNSILGNNNASQIENLESDSSEDASDNESEDQGLNKGRDVAVDLKVESTEHVTVDLTSMPSVSYAPKASKSSSPSDLRIDKSIFIKPRAFHLTILMLKLWNKERVTAASEVLKSVSSKLSDALDNQPISIRLKGLLHATVMNTSHRRGKRRGRNDFFDARNIYRQYGSEEWGEYLIREAHLSQRFVYDENGYYHCCASIPFPESMPED